MTLLLLLFLLQQPPTTRDSSDHLLSHEPRMTARQFQRMPVAARLRLYNARYDAAPQHPGTVGLAFGFRDKPAETLRVIAQDLPPGDLDRFLRYSLIIHDLSLARGNRTCDDPSVATLQSRTRSYRVKPELARELRGITPARCPLF